MKFWLGSGTPPSLILILSGRSTDFVVCNVDRAGPYFFRALVQNDRKGPLFTEKTIKTVYLKLKKTLYFIKQEYSVHRIDPESSDYQNDTT